MLSQTSITEKLYSVGWEKRKVKKFAIFIQSNNKSAYIQHTFFKQVNSYGMIQKKNKNSILGGENTILHGLILLGIITIHLIKKKNKK